MTQSQNILFFRDLWPAACEAQGWDPKDDEKRYDVLYYVTKKQSTTELKQWEITKLFNHVKFLAKPHDLNAALATDDQVGSEQHDRNILVRSILMLEDIEPSYIHKISNDKFPECSRGMNWQKLEIHKLKQLQITLKERARAKAKSPAEEAIPF